MQDERKLSRKERRKLAKERGEDWSTSGLNEKHATELEQMRTAKERKRRAQARSEGHRIIEAIMAAEIGKLLG